MDLDLFSKSAKWTRLYARELCHLFFDCSVPAEAAIRKASLYADVVSQILRGTDD